MLCRHYGKRVSIGRIRLQLKITPGSKSSALRIQETLEVVGVAPKIEFWNPETVKLVFGPVPYGAPTHKEFIDLHTPQEFKRYPIDIPTLVQWLLGVVLATGEGTVSTANVWPGVEWAVASPESRGMSSAGLEAAAPSEAR